LRSRYRFRPFLACVSTSRKIWRAVAVILIGLSLRSEPLQAESDLRITSITGDGVTEANAELDSAAGILGRLDLSRFQRSSASGSGNESRFATPDFSRRRPATDLQVPSMGFSRRFDLASPVGTAAPWQDSAGAPSPASPKNDAGGSTPSVQKKKSKLPWILAIAAGGAVGVALAMKKSGGSSPSETGSNSNPGTIVTVGTPTIGPP
jgi:hypothetical protein